MRSHSGPLTLLEGDELSPRDIELAASIAARYGQGRDAEEVEFEYSDRQQNSHPVKVRPMRPDQIPSHWLI